MTRRRAWLPLVLATALVSVATAQPAGSGADPGSAAGSATGGGSAAAGSGSAAVRGGSAAGSGTSPKVIQLPDDVAAPEVNASASPTVVKLGGRFTVFITATYGDGVEVNLREPVELGGQLEVRKKVSEDRARADGKHTREWQLDVTAWELGELRIPPIAVTYTINGHAGQVLTNMMNVRVDGVLGEAVDDPKLMRDARPPTVLVTRDWFWLWVAGTAGAIVGTAAGYLWLRARRRRHTARLTGGVVATPRRRIDMTGERALERLLAIRESGALEREDDRKTGYAEMVDVIREYLGARYRVATLDLTSSELVRRLASVAPSEEHALIESWLGRCDLVKYGGMRTTTAEAHRVLDDARALIVTTTQLREAALEVAA
jgi:hypothetical protein